MNKNTALKIVDSVTNNLADIKDEIQGYDADKDQVIRYSKKELNKAIDWLGQLNNVQNFLFQLIIDGVRKSYHIMLGYDSVDSFIKSQGYGRTQESQYKKIGNMVNDFSKEINDPDALNGLIENLRELGPGKSYQLFRMPFTDVKAVLIDGGVVEKNGVRISLKDARESSRDELAQNISTVNKEPSSSALKEQIALEKEQSKALKKQLDEAQEKLKVANALQSKYGELANTIEQKLDRLNEAKRIYTELCKVITSANVQEDDPDEVLVEMKELLTRMDLWNGKNISYYSAITENVD